MNTLIPFRYIGFMSSHIKNSPLDEFTCLLMEQMRGIEPPYQPWQGCVLPLNYICMAVQMGLEPTISSVTGRHVNHYTTGPILSARIYYHISIPSASTFMYFFIKLSLYSYAFRNKRKHPIQMTRCFNTISSTQ